MNHSRPILTWIAAAFLVLGLLVPPPCHAVPATEEGRPLVGYPGQNLKLMEGADTVWSRWRVGDKEYFAQPNDWTCSASCFVMMYRTLVGADIPLSEAVRHCGAVEGVGAANSQVVKAFDLLGSGFEIISGCSSESNESLPADAPELRAEKQANLVRLRTLLEDGYLVMLNFREPEENIGHYGILQGLNDRALELADPYYGRRSVLTREKFDYRSGFSKPVLHGWYLAVRPRPTVPSP